MTEVKFHTQPVSISPHSRASVFIEMFRLPEDEKKMYATASGFLWKTSKHMYLFTNWHVVSGIDPNTGMGIGSFTPNFMRIRFFAERRYSSEDHVNQVQMGSMSVDLPLDEHDPLEGWLLHPGGKEIDVVALPMSWDVPTDFDPVCLNMASLSEGFAGEVGDDIFIVGYPEGASFDRNLPLWKRGTIATDIDLNQADLPQYYADTLGNRGLSGSPVLHRVPISLIGDSRGRIISKYSFSGIYSGRLGSKGLKSQIGRIFKPEVIQDIIDVFET